MKATLPLANQLVTASNCSGNARHCAIGLLPSVLPFLPEASYGLRVLSSPASVCVCVCVCVHQSSVCLDDNLSPAQATITKFGPEVQNTLVKIPIVFGVHCL